MIEMTNLEYLVAESYTKQGRMLGDGYWETVYETPIGFAYRNKQKAIEELVLWLREKHKENKE